MEIKLTREQVQNIIDIINNKDYFNEKDDAELVKILSEAIDNNRFNVMFNVGTAKYVINYHVAGNTHGDGSPFYGIKTFQNKKEFEAHRKSLKAQGYSEEN